MTEKQIQIDSGILQFAPKGAFYEEVDEQFKRVFEMWQNLFQYDRTLFCLTTLLGGTGFSKGAMNHMLLSNPQSTTGKELVPEGLTFDFENNVIKYNLTNERTPRALKNLLMLTGGEKRSRVNNARSRKIILEFIFNRDNNNLDNLAVNYKGKLKTLIRHALGKQDLFKILNEDQKLFDKWIGKYNPNSLPVMFYLFDKEIPKRINKSVVFAHFKKISKCRHLKEAAKTGDLELFKKHMKGLPQRTVIGFRNTYKVPIELGDIYEKAKMSNREALQMEAAVKKTGAKAKVNYKTQDIYDLWKAFYFKVHSGDGSNLDKIIEAIDYQSDRANKIDIGEAVVIIDASKSMMGSKERPMHPFLTSLSILSILDNVKDVIYVGGKSVGVKDMPSIKSPGGATDLWRGLVEAVITDAKNILVISDGYENAVKGMFDHVYKHFKESGYEFELMHINPVFSADAKTGTTRKLTDDITPLPVTNYKFLETEIIFNKMIENREVVKGLLINRYQKLIGKGG